MDCSVQLQNLKKPKGQFESKVAKSMVGVSLVVDGSQSLTVAEYIKQRAKEAVGADETPLWGWSVTRLRTVAHGTLDLPSLSLGIGPRGGLGEHGDVVSPHLILTKVSLVERRPENYELWVRSRPEKFVVREAVGVVELHRAMENKSILLPRTWTKIP